jgi:hypothetical protein
MTLGAEPKKIAGLGVLIVIALVMIFKNPFAGDSAPPATATKGSPAAARPLPNMPGYTPPQVERASTRRRDGSGGRVLREDFRPTMKRKPEDKPDPTTVDPSLRTDILDKLQNVSVEGMRRNLFDWGKPPEPKADLTKLAKNGKPVPNPLTTPSPAEAPKPVEPPKPPPPPPIPFKFYGYVNAANQGPKRAFFLDGDDIHVVTEGQMVKRRYRIIRIGVNSVVVEDTEFKNQQTIPLEEQPG